MRHVTLAASLALVAVGLLGGRASAAPFEPKTIPDQVQAVGHLDIDALRKTQLFAAAGGQAAIDAALEEAPPELRPLARSLVQTVRGVAFWRDTEHGAVYLETSDGKNLARLLPKLPAKPAPAIDGFLVYAVNKGHGKGDDDKHGYVSAYGDTLVLADSVESLGRSLRVLGGKAPSLAGSNKLPITSRQGVFVFVTIGDDLLGAIQKSARSKVLQLAIRTIALDVGESAGMVTANARAEMGSADAVQKAKSILDGLRALASLSDDAEARALLDRVTVTVNGLAIEVTAKLPVAELAKAIQSKK